MGYSDRVIYPDPDEMHLFHERMFLRSIERAKEYAETCEENGDEKIADLLRMASTANFCYERQDREGASYRSLAYLAHRWGLSHEERQRFYAVAEEVPLSQSVVTQVINTVEGFNSTIENMAVKGRE